MRVFLTGATGFLGEYLLAELLERGHSVWALFRSERRKLATARFIDSLGLPRHPEQLQWFKGNVLDCSDRWTHWCRNVPGLAGVDTLLHSAASTRLHLDESGDPLKTNLGSAQALANLVNHHPLNVHLISTAYVCGLIKGQRVYEESHPRGDFVNIYEESKWEAEQVWMGRATILRPAIIVGHSETGRCSSFSGWYILFQAVQMLDRLLSAAPPSERQKLDLVLPMDPRAGANIIPVDYVARACIRIMESPQNQNQIFHLTHPHPPAHQWTLDYICKRFGFGGIGLGGQQAQITKPRNPVEHMVWRRIQVIRSHFSNNPLFDRRNTDKALPDLPVPPITASMVDRLIDYAIEKNWGQAIC
jgi:thioester reductase-like protein